MGKSGSIRLIWLGLAMAVLMGMIAWVAHSTSSRIAGLRDNFREVDRESFRIADQFQRSFLELNTALLRAELQKRIEAWKTFDNESNKLSELITTQAPLLRTDEEREILQDIRERYDAYLGLAHKMRNSARAGNPAAQRQGELETMEKQSEELIDLGYDLAAARRETLNTLLTESQQALRTLEAVINGALILLVAMGSWMALLIYRRMIAPLRLQLVESRAVIDRQEKLASLGIVAAGVAHEIRNPLTAIKARLFTQRKQLQPGSDAAEDAGVIEEEINRLERIVKEFLQFARPAEPELRPMDPRGLLEEVASLLRPDLTEQEIDVVVEETVPDRFRGDAGQLKQVLINLIRNGAESIGRKGQVRLRATTGTKTLAGVPRAVVILEVQDTGKGMSEQVRTRLFDPFYTTKENGTGLGLSLSSRIIEKHGGALQYQTEVGRGTVFGIILPRDDA